MSKAKTVKIVPVSDEATMQAKNDAMKDHYARIKKALSIETLSGKKNLKDKISVGEKLAEAEKTLKNWKVSFKSIYEHFELPKSSADLYKRFYNEQEKLTDCLNIADAMKIMYPASSKTPEEKAAEKEEKLEKAIEEKQAKKTPTQRRADIIKEITRLPADMKHYHKILDAMNEHFPVTAENAELKIAQ